MKDIVSQILSQYFKKMREPKIEELEVSEEYTTKTGCCFVTLYLNGEIQGSAGNVKEIHPNIAGEILSNTLQALTGDKRFTPLTLEQSEKIGFRIDTITHRDMVSLKDIGSLDPVKNGVIAIHRNYETLAVILPNISAKLMTGSDIMSALGKKLEDKKIEDKNYIFYKITTESESNF